MWMLALYISSLSEEAFIKKPNQFESDPSRGKCPNFQKTLSSPQENPLHFHFHLHSLEHSEQRIQLKVECSEQRAQWSVKHCEHRTQWKPPMLQLWENGNASVQIFVTTTTKIWVYMLFKLSNCCSVVVIKKVVSKYKKYSLQQ